MKRFNKSQKTIFILTIIVVLEFIGLCNLHNHECEERIVEVPIIKERVVEEPKPTFQSLGTYKLTAYCPCISCCGKSDGITASGAKAVEGVTIAAPKNLPFGTKILIEDHEYTVQDRGGAITGNRIDVYFDTHQEALEFGVQYKEIFKKGV